MYSNAVQTAPFKLCIQERDDRHSALPDSTREYRLRPGMRMGSDSLQTWAYQYCHRGGVRAMVREANEGHKYFIGGIRRHCIGRYLFSQSWPRSDSMLTRTKLGCSVSLR